MKEFDCPIVTPLQNRQALRIVCPLQSRQFLKVVGVAQVSQEMVADDAAGEVHQDGSQGGQPFPLRDISGGKGDSVKNVVSGNP